MNYSEDDMLMLSALQHLVFCERQCALIHIEQQWQENRLTVLGSQMHEKVHSVENENRTDIRIVRGLRLVSHKLGLVGQADVIEYHATEKSNNSVKLNNVKGWWMPYPVEYKRGRPKKDNSDKVQVCAQALCLEEMSDISISKGALYYGKNRRRQEIFFDNTLRQETINAAKRLHELISSRVTPKPVYAPKCERCSFLDVCLPKTMGKEYSVDNYLSNMI